MASSIDATKPVVTIPTTSSVRANFAAAKSEIEALQDGTKTVTDSITAGTTQTQAGATALTTYTNRVTVSGTDGDGVKLPTAVAGLEVLVINDDSAQTIQIWPNTDDKIDGGVADAVDGNTLAAAASRRYIATDTTNWYTATTAAGSGDVGGPGASTDEAVARFSGAGGETLQNSGVLIDDTDNVTGVTTLTVDGDTSAGDTATLGYTATEGLIVTGQGSTNDVTIKNDADAEVMGVLTGTTTADFKGVVTATTFEPDGDTAAADSAAIGYTATEGLILTGQGSTNDVTVKNDADADVLVIPTGTTNVDIVGVATASTFEPDGDTAAADNAAIGYTATEGLILTGQGSSYDVTMKNDADTDVLRVATGGTSVEIPGTLELGDATANTLSASGGVLSIEGNVVHHTGGTDITVADGGTGASTLTDGGILFGSGTDPVTAMAVLAAGEIVVGDGTTDPAALAAFTDETGPLLASMGGTIGQQTIIIPAAAMEPAVTTAPATSAVVEIGTSLFAARTMNFASDAPDFAYFGFQMPKGFDETSTVVAQFGWSATGQGAGNDSVVWQIAGAAYASDDPLTGAFPTATDATLQEHSATNDDIMITAETAGLDIDNIAAATTPGAEEFFAFEVSRKTGSDDLDVAARLHFIKLHITLNAGTDD